MYENISPSMVRGLSPELILQYLQTDYKPLYESLRQSQADRQFNTTQRYNRRKDEEDLAFDREKEQRQAGNDVFAQGITRQQEQRAAEKYNLGKTPYDKNYLAGLFKTFSGGDAPQELIDALTSVNREEAAGLLPGLSQYAINQRQQKTQEFKESEREKAQGFKAEQTEKAADRKAAFQAYAEEAAMSRIKMRAGLKMSAQEDQQAFLKDRAEFQAQQKILLQEGRLDAAQAMQNVRIFTDTHMKLRDQAIREAGLRSDPNRQGQTININYGNVPEQVDSIMGSAPRPHKKEQAPSKFGYSPETGAWGTYGASEMPAEKAGRAPKQPGPMQPSMSEDVGEIEQLVDTGNQGLIMQAIKRVQSSKYPQDIKIAMLKRLEDGMKSATAPAWRRR